MTGIAGSRMGIRIIIIATLAFGSYTALPAQQEESCPADMWCPPLFDASCGASCENGVGSCMKDPDSGKSCCTCAEVDGT